MNHKRQWTERISSLETRRQWGDLETIGDKICLRHLQWLGHVSRMQDRIPRHLLFGSMQTPRPCHKPRKRWKDCVKADLKLVGLSERSWVDVVADRSAWRTRCREATDEAAVCRASNAKEANLECPECLRSFRRRQDIVRHKCKLERAKPIANQKGSVQCSDCGRWLLSKGGLANHRCQPVSVAPAKVDDLLCSRCGRSFRSVSGRSRHKCKGTTPTPKSSDLACQQCHRQFRSVSGRSRHKCKTDR